MRCTVLQMCGNERKRGQSVSSSDSAVTMPVIRLTALYRSACCFICASRRSVITGSKIGRAQIGPPSYRKRLIWKGRANSSSHHQPRVAFGTCRADGRAVSRKVALRIAVLHSAPDGLQVECMAADALVDESKLRRRAFNLGSGSIDANKEANVEVDRERQQRDDVALVSVGCAFDGSENNAQGLWGSKEGERALHVGRTISWQWGPFNGVAPYLE